MTSSSDMLPEGVAQQRELLKRLLQEKAERSLQGPASCAQRRLWFVNRLEAPNPSYNITCYTVLRGSLDIDLLARSLNALVRRQAALSTSFVEVDGEPAQRIAPELLVSLSVEDLTHLPGTEAQASLNSGIEAEAREPFDLETAPLFRVRLFKRQALEHVLVLVQHHIISDGWSVGVLIRELFKLYEGLRSGADARLPELTIQYMDYTARQSRWLKSDEYFKQRSYWVERLANLPTMHLPTDHARPLNKQHRGRMQVLTLDGEHLRKLSKLCADESATLFMALLAAFSALLSRYTGQSDIVVGTPIANRNTADLESLIGFFINMLVMRTDLSGNPTFRQLLSRVAESTFAAYSNQDVPYELLVEALQPERDASRNPLFQVAIALQNEPISGISIDGLEVGQPVVPGYDISELDVDLTFTRVDLELHLWEGANGLRGVWVFDATLYDGETIARMNRHLIELLKRLGDNPDRPVAEIALFTPQEERLLLEQGVGNAVEYARDRAVHALFEEWVGRDPGAPALVFDSDSLSYHELNVRANRLAGYLQRIGVSREEPVGVCLERGSDLIVAMLAVFKAGAAYVPLDPAYPVSRLAYMIRDSGLSAVISRGELVDILGDSPVTRVLVDVEAERIGREDPGNPVSGADGKSLAYVIYTSGSTGRPKGVLVEHEGLCKVSAEQVRWFGVGPGSRVLQFSSPNFDASLFDFAMALTTGATMVMARHEELQPGPPLARVLHDRRITILTIPPSSLSMLPADSLPDLEVINVAGEVCPPSLVERWARGRRFFNLYGPTECTIWSTAQECVANGTVPSIGRPIGNTRVYILDEYGRPVPPGVTGELCIGGVGVARGYLNLPDLTEERFAVDPLRDAGGRLYRTGDIGRYRSDGALEFIGRLDHQVKLRGFRIETGEIESVLSRQPGIEAAVVVLREDAPGENVLVAYFVSAAGESLRVDDLRSALRSELPAHMLPGALVSLPRLPLTPNGKIDHKALPAPSAQRKTESEYTAPSSGLEADIAAIWAEVLRIQEVGVDENFFDLGGDSFRLVRVHSAVEELLGRELPIADLFRHPTIRSLADSLADREGADDRDAGVQRAKKRADRQRAVIARRRKLRQRLNE